VCHGPIFACSTTLTIKMKVCLEVTL
jgi:hypothetical protein